ncbi:MAG: sodium:alanine symporter family protein [Clostridia bacterium]|nr:sodium:alanine symporter family protein [Clostridia bacterium]
MLEWINANLFSIAVPCALVLTGLFFTLRTGLACAAHPKSMLRGMLQGAESGTSPLRALTLALAGTLGVGNLVGVASAIWYGGAGAVFWMWVSAFVAMTLKYAEVVLAVSHRRTDKNGNHRGGAMYYILDCFRSRGCAWLGKLLAAAFAALCVLDGLSMGCVIQTNAIGGVFEGICGIPPLFTGALLCIATLAIMLGGSQRIMKATDVLVPLMTGGFALLSIAVLVLRAPQIPSALRSIMGAVSDLRALLGGAGGFAVARALRYGAMRGLVSNEAGCGTAPIAHACANTDHPAKQGFWGIFEVFADTLVLCSMTALVILVSYDKVQTYGDNSIMMTVRAYTCVLGEWSGYFLCAMVLFFGFATVVCWGHYALEALSYLTESRGVRIGFICVFSLGAAVGTVVAPTALWQVADLAIGAMTLINLAVLLLMQGEVRRWTVDYFSR